MAALKSVRAPAALATGRKAAAPRVSVAVRASNNPNLECKQHLQPLMYIMHIIRLIYMQSQPFPRGLRATTPLQLVHVCMTFL